MACSFAKLLDSIGYKAVCEAHDSDYDKRINLGHKIGSDVRLALSAFKVPKHGYLVGFLAFILLTILPVSYYRYYKTFTPWIVWSVLFITFIEISRTLYG